MSSARWVAVGLLMATGSAFGDGAPRVRFLPIPAEEHGYKTFHSEVFRSVERLDAFLKDMENAEGWNDFPAFSKALRAAKVDFAKEDLVLLRHYEGSCSVKVWMGTPKWEGKALICPIYRKVPVAQDQVEVNYGFALAVPKGKAKRVELWKQQEVVRVPDK